MAQRRFLRSVCLAIRRLKPLWVPVCKARRIDPVAAGSWRQARKPKQPSIPILARRSGSAVSSHRVDGHGHQWHHHADKQKPAVAGCHRVPTLSLREMTPPFKGANAPSDARSLEYWAESTLNASIAWLRRGIERQGSGGRGGHSEWRGVESVSVC